MLGAEDAESSLMAMTLLLDAWKRKSVAPPVASTPSHVVFVGQDWSGKNDMIFGAIGRGSETDE